jgi:hypothetical protein
MYTVIHSKVAMKLADSLQGMDLDGSNCSVACNTGEYACMTCQDDHHCQLFDELDAGTCGDYYACILPSWDPTLAYDRITATSSEDECNNITLGMCSVQCGPVCRSKFAPSNSVGFCYSQADNETNCNDDLGTWDPVKGRYTSTC